MLGFIYDLRFAIAFEDLGILPFLWRAVVPNRRPCIHRSQATVATSATLPRLARRRGRTPLATACAAHFVRGICRHCPLHLYTSTRPFFTRRRGRRRYNATRWRGRTPLATACAARLAQGICRRVSWEWPCSPPPALRTGMSMRITVRQVIGKKCRNVDGSGWRIVGWMVDLAPRFDILL